MKNKPCALLGALLLLPILPTTSNAADPVQSEASVDVDVFQGPELITRELHAGHPGDSDEEAAWVQLNFMVSTSGKPYEATVVDSSGGPEFEKAALHAIRGLRYKPAMHGKTPVDSSQDLVILFERRLQGARPEFVRDQQEATRAIDKADRAAADAALEELTAKNLYEETHRALTLYKYHLKWGTEAQQLDDLHRAVRFERQKSFFSKKELAPLMGGVLRLELKQREYGDALVTWNKLQELGDKDEVTAFQGVMQKVDALRRSDTPISAHRQISRGNSWHGRLFKHRFEIRVTEGIVSEIKLRCEKHYLFFQYEAGVRYEVSAGDGLCGIEVIGEKGTKFDLLES